MATETEFDPMSREMAETRWEGLLLDFTGDELLTSKLSNRLQKTLEELLGGASQMPMKGNATTQDLTDAMCAWVMQWAMSGGVLPTKGREVTFGYVSPFPEDRAALAATVAASEFVRNADAARNMNREHKANDKARRDQVLVDAGLI